ncbi:unnamed protein product [Protopolystoma xenopodis]|uniref:Uncharacterized protein n=1 Tax=Protopolystoma xenopodis TaxID=117903 RepID=A0A3S5ASD1_9PLAT|nr:unnamed protein product [Protopolystoma xenopodis]
MMMLMSPPPSNSLADDDLTEGTDVLKLIGNVIDRLNCSSDNGRTATEGSVHSVLADCNAVGRSVCGLVSSSRAADLDGVGDVCPPDTTRPASFSAGLIVTSSNLNSVSTSDCLLGGSGTPVSEATLRSAKPLCFSGVLDSHSLGIGSQLPLSPACSLLSAIPGAERSLSSSLGPHELQNCLQSELTLPESCHRLPISQSFSSTASPDPSPRPLSGTPAIQVGLLPLFFFSLPDLLA